MKAEYNMNKRFHRWLQEHVNIKYFDEEDSEKVVEDYITDQMVTDVEYEMEENDWFDNYLSEYSLVIYPNIPIVMEFFKKWNEEKDILIKGKKWILISRDQDLNTFWDLDAYSDDFNFVHLNNKTYNFYVKNYPMTEIKREDYEYEPYEETIAKKERKNETDRERLDNMDPDIILDYVKDMYNQGVYKREEIAEIFDFVIEETKEE
jgi:hypothetical protein